MKENFEKAFRLLLEFEGENSYDDWGGTTLFGISNVYFPEIVKKIQKAKTKEEKLKIVEEFYKENFWEKIRGDIKEYPLDIISFDTAVNLGVGRVLEFRKEYWEIKNLILLECAYILLRRMIFYIDKCIENKKKRKYLFGWLVRCRKLFSLIEEEIKQGGKNEKEK